MSKGQDWKDIIIDYGKVLAQELRISNFVCESKLPYQKCVIKKAIFDALENREAGNRNLEPHLENAFTNLAQFIPAAEMNIVHRVETALREMGKDGPSSSSADQSPVHLAKLGLQLKPDVDRYNEIHNRVRQKQEEYRRQFQERNLE